tara:strand:+ start:308 stop:499 length:192 start_codon:yes stop_codon:yes gene_type:complete
MFKDSVFSKADFEGQATGGVWFRSFDLNKFLEKIEADDKEVVGIRFEGNNLEVLINDNPRIEI